MKDKLINCWQGMRLVGKHSLIVMVATFTIMPATFGAIWYTSRVAFLEIESRNIEAQSKRAKSSLALFEEGLSKSLGDYANWDDSYVYMDSPTKKFEDSTLNPNTFKNMGVDVVTYVRFDGKTVFARTVDTEALKVLDAETEYFKSFTSTGTFFEQAKANPKFIAYVRSERGLYVLYSAWVTDSNGSAKPSGFMVMGNLLNTKALSNALQSDARLNLNVPAGMTKRLSSTATPIISDRVGSNIHSSLGLFDQDQKLLATVDFDMPRSLIQAGRKALFSLVGALALGLMLLVAVLAWGIRKISVRRIQLLETYVKNFKTDGRKLHATLTAGNDEIAALGREFEALSAKLNEAEEQLRERSYLQGKADSAAGMLHNVRNALAPIRVIQEKWLSEETLPFRSNLRKAAEELAAEGVEPARKAALEQFMLTAARQIAMSSQGRIKEMEDAKESIDHVSAILSTYNFDTSASSYGEDVDLGAMLKREAAIVAARESGGFELVCLEDLPMVDANRVQLGQVIGNIFVNADEAMIASGVKPKRVVVDVVDRVDHWEIHFTDNGDGIAEEDLTKIFQRGYSTRNHKAGGLGMHWSANAMRAMGGSIIVESEGKGWGATAILTLRKVSRTEFAEAA